MMWYRLTFSMCCIFVLNGSVNTNSNTHVLKTVCRPHVENESLVVLDLVGSWITVYAQPTSINCFILHIRATTDLERGQCFVKYGDFNGRVYWSKCLLEVESPLGKHYLQETDNYTGILENIIIMERNDGKYELHEQNADQWFMFGRRGSELLLMRDCHGDGVAIFVRAPYWPAADDLYAVLHRSGIAPRAIDKLLCEPLDRDAQQFLHQYISKEIRRG